MLCKKRVAVVLLAVVAGVTIGRCGNICHGPPHSPGSMSAPTATTPIVASSRKSMPREPMVRWHRWRPPETPFASSGPTVNCLARSR